MKSNMKIRQYQTNWPWTSDSSQNLYFDQKPQMCLAREKLPSSIVHFAQRQYSIWTWFKGFSYVFLFILIKQSEVLLWMKPLFHQFKWWIPTKIKWMLIERLYCACQCQTNSKMMKHFQPYWFGLKPCFIHKVQSENFLHVQYQPHWFSPYRYAEIWFDKWNEFHFY